MSDDIHYENGQPTFTGDYVVKCFKDSGNGLLFRIENNLQQKWAFYNDTTNYNMVVRCVFGKTSQIKPLGSTTLTTNDETGDMTCEVTVPPTSTEMFIEGVPNGYKFSFDGKPVPKASRKTSGATEKKD